MNLNDLLAQGDALLKQNRTRDAAEQFARATQIDEKNLLAWDRLGQALLLSGFSGEAADAFARLVALTPQNAAARYNHAVALCECAQIDSALDEFRHAEELEPANPQIASGRLYYLNFADSIDEAQLIEAHRFWATRFADTLKSAWLPHTNSRDPQRKLKVGYVSPDFKLHPVARFMLPLFVEHDRSQFEIHVYNTGADHADEMTNRVRSRCDGWCNCGSAADESVAAKIRADGIDILIDLGMHARPGLLIFARKPAPVQITYLHYVGTTGLEAIDWRISTFELEPQTLGFVEKPLWLPAYFCYKPSIWNIEPGPPPSEKNGFITFGSLNAFKKAGATSRRLWAKVMGALPDSRMIVHTSEGSHREQFLADMGCLGIASQRFEFVGLLPIDQYMAVYRRIDICLDTFPYAGGTTTCDALWMGVPVITLAGKLPISRMGAAILPVVGLDQCVGHDEGEYVAAALKLADPQALNDLRNSLRQMIKASPSPWFDARAFARSIEAAYRRAWQEWCHRSS